MKRDFTPAGSAILAAMIYLSNVVYIIWAIINFILYLVKDKPFDWLPVWLLIGTVSAILLFILTIFILSMGRGKLDESSYSGIKKKSGFEQRLEKMREEKLNK